MIELLRATALVASAVGYLILVRRRSGLDVAAVPVVTLCGGGLVVLTGGLVGLLLPATWLVLGGGIVALALELVRHRRESFATLRHPVLVVLAAATAGLAVLLHGLEYAHYDNFSHWALVVRVMLERDAFPTPDDPVIAFTSYPLGGASFAYAISRVLGVQEWHAMLGQAVLTLSALLPLAAFSRRHRWVGATLAVVTSAAVGAHANQPTTLLVDGLVGALAAAGVLIAVRHRGRMRVALLPLAVILAFLTVVKASGLFFILVVTGIVLALGVRRPWRRPPWASLWRWGVFLAAPWAAFGAWTVHVRSNFPDVADSPHSLAGDRLAEALAAKSPAVRAEILDLLLTHVRGDATLWVVLAAGLVVLGLLWRTRAISGRAAVVAGVGTLVAVVTYGAGILAMYLASMPTSEALHLAGVRRYSATGEVVLLAGVLAGVLVLLDRSRGRLARLATTTGAFALAGVVVWPLSDPATLVRPDLTGSVRAAANEAVAGHSVDPSHRICVVVDAHDASYRRFVVRYLLLAPDVKERLITPSTSANGLSSCDEVVLLGPNPRAVEMLAELGVRLPHPPPVMVSR